MELRPFQIQSVEDARDALRSGIRRLIIYGPTGSGKTVIAAKIMELAVGKGKRVVFVVNRITLVKQASVHLRKVWDLVHGIVQGDNTWGTDRDILVCSVNTLARRGYPPADLVIIDEAHGATSPTYRKLIKHYENTPCIGLTATPFTKGLGTVFDRLIISATIPELIAKGHLVDCEIYAPPGPDLADVPLVRATDGYDYSEKHLGKVVDKPTLLGNIVSHWQELANGQSTFVFATNILHSKHIVEEFLRRGIPAEHMDAYTEGDDRDAMFARFESGETLVLSCVAVLAEGVDMPRASVMILARPTKSLTRYIQMAGRILRPFPGKAYGLILDHSTTSHHLGYPTTELPLELDGGSPSEQGEKSVKPLPSPKPCPRCHFLIPAGQHICPKCHFEMQAQNKVNPIEGKLTKLERKYLFTDEELQEFWSGCLGLAGKRNRSRGWAAHLYHDITHQYPSGLLDEPCEPCDKVRNMDTHNRMKYAMGKRRDMQ
jgi:superfamily II DNA or RNA helicase